MGDARTERWVAHRVRVRSELIDAAMRAIDVNGPGISMREIAEEAQIPKPNLYRFFTDKSELADAIGDRVRDQLTERIRNGPNEAGATVGSFLRSGIITYLELADEHPNIFRFVLPTSSASVDAGLARTSSAALDLAAVLRAVLGPVGATDSDVELTAYMLVGMIMTAGHWWLLRKSTGIGDRAELSAVIDKLDRNTRTLIDDSARAHGTRIDFDAPIAGYVASASDIG
ncbi:TetR/AcrR family transcriptional regulator [Nocardia flavorosea]|uniref:TetR/AcrR family transcriptional regulator n=1 Tax=Nocardia flavorosea TaxID=53429 RepID=A0A846YUC9_9NOCA|nr:TetR/AcrR family transcriptional regulator [Nocardia flavorosea]NKY61054.1 TetR/AcrR family transcriptional regulator [Nocardia flavorosea]